VVSNPTDGVQLVNEHHGGGRLASLGEELAHARRASSDEHFHKLWRGDGEKRDASLAVAAQVQFEKAYFETSFFIL
jgi:hypothetical protein